MWLRSLSPILEGWEGEAEITADHPASSYGLPVLLVEDEVVGTLDAAISCYEIVEATEEERQSLERGGYTSML